MPDQATDVAYAKSAASGPCPFQGMRHAHLLVCVLWRLLNGKEDLGLAELLYAQAASVTMSSTVGLHKVADCRLQTLHVSLPASAKDSRARCTEGFLMPY